MNTIVTNITFIAVLLICWPLAIAWLVGAAITGYLESPDPVKPQW